MKQESNWVSVVVLLVVMLAFSLTIMTKEQRIKDLKDKVDHYENDMPSCLAVKVAVATPKGKSEEYLWSTNVLDASAWYLSRQTGATNDVKITVVNLPAAYATQWSKQ